MITLLAFVGAIVLLVLVHELGHYWVARRCGVRVLRFSLGFGRVIYSKRFASSSYDQAQGRGTEWVISAIPLGGYVKMLDEREEEVAPEDLPYAFNRKPVLQRMAIVAAGPLANFALAILLYWTLFMHGVPGLKPVLGEVPQGTPAAAAQLQTGETIISVAGETVPSWQELRWALLNQALQHREVVMETLTASGMTAAHTLDLSMLEAKDLDGEFLDKLGLHLYQPVILPVIGKFADDSVAQRAGLQAGDLIQRADGVQLQRWSELVEAVRARPGQVLHLDVQRGDMTLSVAVVPEAVVESGKSIGRIGAGPNLDQAAWDARFIEVSYGPVEAGIRALRKTWETSAISLKMMGKMVTGEISVKNLSGPISIADYAGQSAHMGLVAYLGFLALISISLGVLNLLPVPLLDGGHLLYYGAEFIKGRPVSDLAWEIGQKIGIALLGTLIMLALYNDVNRLISG